MSSEASDFRSLLFLLEENSLKVARSSSTSPKMDSSSGVSRNLLSLLLAADTGARLTLEDGRLGLVGERFHRPPLLADRW